MEDRNKYNINEKELFNDQLLPQVENVDDLDDIILESDGETVYYCHPLKKRSFLSRLCGRMNNGSLRGSVLNLVTVSLGAGILTIPYNLNILSLFFGILIIAFCGFNLLLNLYFLASVSNKKKIYNYSQLIREILGYKASFAYNIFTIIYLIGVLIYFQVLIYRMISTISFDFFYKGNLKLEEYLDHGILTGVGYKFPISFGVAIVMLLPLSLNEQFTQFKVFSIIPVFSIIYLIVVRLLLLIDNDC